MQETVRLQDFKSLHKTDIMNRPNSGTKFKNRVKRQHVSLLDARFLPTIFIVPTEVCILLSLSY